MASETEEKELKFSLILINVNIKRPVWLSATVLDSVALREWSLSSMGNH